ncbi:UNVERIFIED_CONTAM: Secreted RxLR effector protein [Sesamum indicum]
MASTSLPLGIKLSTRSALPLSNPELYQRLVGRLLYLGFKGHSDTGFFFPVASSFSLTTYCSTERANCMDSKRSLTGYCVFLGSSLISWKTKKQTTIACSTAEAEYRGLGTPTCELRWISYLLQDLHIPISTPIPLFCDNQAAIHIVANPIFNERTKHFEIDCHLVHDQFKTYFILPTPVPSSSQLADLFTNLLPASSFARLLSKMGLSAFPQVHLEGRC